MCSNVCAVYAVKSIPCALGFVLCVVKAVPCALRFVLCVVSLFRVHWGLCSVCSESTGDCKHSCVNSETGHTVTIILREVSN